MKSRSSLSWSRALPLVLLLVLLATLRFQPAKDTSSVSAVLEKRRVATLPPKPVDLASLDAFDAWLTDGVKSTSAARGVELARERRVAMKELIQVNPQAALERAVPYALRKQLPIEVLSLLEKPVGTAADLVVEQACGDRPWRQQWLILDGMRVLAFTYGQRAETMTKEKLSVHGIAIDEVMAMLDDPLRELSAAEAADKGLDGRVVQLGKRLLAVESDEALEAARQQLRKTEQTLGPVGMPAYRELALGRMDGIFPLAMQGGVGGTEEDLPPVAFSAWTEGAKTMLYIRARFADEAPASEPLALATAQSRQGGAENFWLENSYGKSSLTTTYTNVVTLPSNASAYVDNFSLLLTHARQAAVAANPAWNHANFDFHTIITTGTPNLFKYIGIAQLGGPSSHLLANFTTIRTASHEYGHNLGLNHSEYWLTDSPSPIGRDSIPGGYVEDNADDERIEYGHKFAVMGSQDGSGDFENGRAHYTASDKNRLDWLTGSDIFTTTTSGTFRLHRHDVASNFGSMTPGAKRAIKINLPATDPTGFANPYKYWLNYRQLPTDGIAENWLPHGLQVDWRRDAGSFQFRAVQLDMTPFSRDSGPYGAGLAYAFDNNDKEDSVLLVGRTFSDTGADIHFTPIAKGGTSPNEWLDVVVNIGTQGTNAPPAITNLAVSNANPAVGETVSFAVTATDPNADPLAYHWDMGDDQPQLGQFNNSNQTKSWSAAGYYVVLVEVSDMKGGKTTATRVISVGSPSNSGTWTNASGGSWGTNTNWTGNLIAGGEGNTADFSTLNPTADVTVNLDVTRAIGSLIFGDMNTGSAATWFLANGASGSLILAGSNPTITVNPLGSGKFANISALLSGFNGLTKNGNGNLILNNANNELSGPVVMNGGNLQLNNASLTRATSMAINAGNLVVATSAANAIGGTISFGGGSLQFNNPPGTDYSPQFSNAANQSYRISVGSAHEVSFNGSLSSTGGTLTKLGTGTLILGAANSYSGGSTLSNGTLRIGSNSALGSGPLAITANSTLQAAFAASLTNPVSIANGITGTLDTNGNNVTLGGAITGAGTLTKSGLGTLTLSGGLTNTLAGGIHLNSGRLDVLDGLSLTNTSGTINLVSGAVFNYSKNFDSGNNLTRPLTLRGPGAGGLGALNLRGNATATGPITLAADATISHDFNTATISGGINGATATENLTLTTLTTGSPQPGMTVSGPIALGAGGITVIGVANSGSFSIRLSGSNSYTGETRVVTGTLMLTGNSRISDLSAVRVETGAVLHLDFNGTDTVGSLFLGTDPNPKPNGTYGSLTSSAANKSAAFLGNGILQVGVPNNFASWAGLQAPPVTGGPNGDDDADGASNLIEYALANGGERGVFSGNTLTFAKRGAPYGSDLTYVIETSETLSGPWSPAVTHGPAQLGLPISYTFTPIPGTPKQFARLKVVMTP